jgi:uncharacterized protein YecA (UPF0149 family)
MFEELMTHIKTEVSTSVFRATTVQNFQRMMAGPGARVQTLHEDINMLAGGVQTESTEAEPQPPRRELSADVPQSAVANFDAMMQALEKAERAPASRTQAVQSEMKSAGRNDPCPCGSGKKYKKCCGQGL